MAISFEESRKKLQGKQAEPVMAMEMPLMAENEAFAVMADSASEDDFVKSEKYLVYNNYSDDKYSSIDAQKNITVDSSQINITQEQNSQYIPFEMPRYYDGIDLMEMTIQFHYVNKENEESYSNPVNVSFNAEKIRFAWLIDEHVTNIEGEVIFEIIATGTNEKNENYVWKTRPNGKLNVLKSLTGNGVISPGDDWYMGFVRQMNEKLSQAQSAAEAAEQSAEKAKQAVANVDDKINNAANGIKSEIQSDLDTNYAKKTEVNALADKVNSLDGLANFDVTYNADTKDMTFKNGETEIKKITLDTTPTTEWTTAYGKTVDAKIETAVKPVRDDLATYKTSNDAAVNSLQDSVGNLPETLKTSYYNKEATDTLLAKKADASVIEGIRNEVTQAKNNVADMQGTVDSLNTAVGEIQGMLDDIGKNAGHEYDITYEDSKLTLMEDGTPKMQVTIVGGGGGGPAAGSTITIERIGESAITAVAGDPVVVKFRFTSVDSAGDDTGNATGTWYVGNTKVATKSRFLKWCKRGVNKMVNNK